MPPKPKYTKDEIIRAAYDLTRENGIDAVVAREVGKKLGTSATPIFTVFNSMEDLKAEVVALAKKAFLGEMTDIFDYTPAFKEYGLRWIRFARKEKNLYRLLFQIPHQGQALPEIRTEFSELYGKLVEEIVEMFDISEKSAENLIDSMSVLANGYAGYMLNSAQDFTDEELSKTLTQVCIGIVLTEKLANDTIPFPAAKAISKRAMDGLTPQKKDQRNDLPRIGT